MNSNEETTGERLLDGMTAAEIIFRCGELQLPLDQTVLLVGQQHKIDRARLLADLQTPGTPESESYRSGVAQGNFELNASLAANVSDAKSRDAYKHLAAERHRQLIDEKLNELFEI